MIYVCQISENHLITHDGHVQLGSLHCTLEWYLDKVQVPVSVVYWIPNAFGSRYPRVNYQRHMAVAGKCALEQIQPDYSDKHRSWV
jgi:hypothetical protein